MDKSPSFTSLTKSRNLADIIPADLAASSCTMGMKKGGDGQEPVTAFAVFLTPGFAS
ncbi:hypothetical protein [Actinoplanes sp. G11-F43]|uniref:hypothetical protein n=1 Tax=Actinoplanes sp. G11-F43 TaxID=3424130 RepID=UPI003D329A52